MDRITITWLLYGIIGFILGLFTLNNVICTTSSTIILSLYGIIGIVLVLTVKNKQENLTNYASIDKKGMTNIHTTGEQHNELEQSVNNKHLKLQPSQLSKCDSDNALYFNPLPHEYKNGLLGTSNDPLPSKYDPFNSSLIGTYTTNQVSYKFNMA